MKDSLTKDISKIYECSDEGKEKIFQALCSNINVLTYLNKDIIDIFDENELYTSFQVDKLLTRLKRKNINIDDILEICYNSQRGNSLLLITFFIHRKKLKKKALLKD